MNGREPARHDIEARVVGAASEDSMTRHDSVGSPEDSEIPLCVEPNGTLIRSDLFHEGLARLFKQHLGHFLAALFRLALGRRALRAEIAERVDLGAAALPENEKFLEWLRQQRQMGRRVVLCSSVNDGVAQGIAQRYPVFDEVIAGGGEARSDGAGKAARLLGRFGEGRYDYAGCDPRDLGVWEKARRAVIVEPGRAMRRKLGRLPRVEQVFSTRPHRVRELLRALRLHQWAKNVLIFLPAAAGHQLLNAHVVLESVAAFVIFGLCASGTYLLNDLMDLDADRRHPEKRRRPFASGRLSVGFGLTVAPALVMFGLVSAALLLGWIFFATLAIYVVATVWYSRSLKRIPMVDVLALAGLYAIRVIAGSAATAIVPSFWLLAFTMFLFLSLAIAKRYSELKLMMATGRTSASGRGYTVDDAPILQVCGVAAGYNSVLVMALYVNSGVAVGMYAHTIFLWFLCPLLLYWITRVWIKTSRGQMDNDPVVFTLQDRPSLAVACVGLLLIWAAT
jgi:4-hydroxybenzoate polyprenyltransferase